jgi:hypothetical protein
MVNIFTSNTKIIKRKRKFTGATIPNNLEIVDGIAGKILITINIRDNKIQKIESSICAFEFLIFLIMYTVVNRDATISTTLNTTLILSPPVRNPDFSSEMPVQIK